jgi:hypothetical protein
MTALGQECPPPLGMACMSMMYQYLLFPRMFTGFPVATQGIFYPRLA